MKTQIFLNETEKSIARHIAKQRYENARSKGIVDGKMGRQSNYDTDLEGAAAELAFCKDKNIYPDLENRVDLGYDCMYYGTRIDVKATKYKTGRLLATLKKKVCENVDVFVLMVGSFSTYYTIVGAVAKEDFIRDENIKDLGRGKGYCLDQSQLSNLVTAISKSKRKNHDIR